MAFVVKELDGVNLATRIEVPACLKALDLEWRVVIPLPLWRASKCLQGTLITGQFLDECIQQAHCIFVKTGQRI